MGGPNIIIIVHNTQNIHASIAVKLFKNDSNLDIIVIFKPSVR